MLAVPESPGILSRRLFRFRLWERSGRRCRYCRRPVSKRRATLDHVVPRSHGGRYAVVCCSRCNEFKSDKTFRELAAWLVRVAALSLVARLRKGVRP